MSKTRLISNEAVRAAIRSTDLIGAMDQVFTDLLAAKCAGVKMALTTPFEEESGWSFRVRRRSCCRTASEQAGL